MYLKNFKFEYMYIFVFYLKTSPFPIDISNNFLTTHLKTLIFEFYFFLIKIFSFKILYTYFFFNLLKKFILKTNPIQTNIYNIIYI